MTSPALGIAYSFWLRLRWMFAAVFILLPIFAVTVQLFPAAAPYCQVGSIILMFSVMVPMLNACTFGPADLGARASGYPTHMFVLPLSNRSLVAWPMLYGAIIFGSLWTLVAVLVFIPSGLPLPVTWPAAMLAAICVWVQAVGWSPFPSPFIRVPALVIAVCPLFLLPMLVGLRLPPAGHTVPILVACSMAWTLVAFFVADRGLRRARSGGELDWFQNVADRIAVTLGRQFAANYVGRRPFRSAATAQLWHECRRNALVTPVMMGLFGVPFLVVVCQSVIGNRDHSGLAVGSVNISPALLSLAICIGLPVMISAVGGSGLAKFDIWGKDQMPSFFAIRPMSTGQFVCIKLAAVALSTLAIWAIMLGMVLIWAALEASPLNSRESIVRAALAQATPRTVAIFFAALFGLAALMFRNFLVAMWPTLIGRKWVSVAVAVNCTLLIGGSVLAGTWVYHHPEFRRHLPAFLPWIVAYMLAEKFFGAVAVGTVLRKWDMISANRLAAVYAGWFLLAGLLLGVTCCFGSPTWMLAAGVVLALPFSRVVILPLALHWNRHR